MENSYFIYAPRPITIKKFHNCIWEFGNNSSLVEFGMEISSESLNGDNQLELTFYAPWITSKCIIHDLYSKLKDTANSRFIFNDSVKNTVSLDGGNNNSGIIHEFGERERLCILPIRYTVNGKRINIRINLTPYIGIDEKPNIYIRFCIAPRLPYISTRKKGISKTNLIYDIKINERRNIPDDLSEEIMDKEICKVDECFSFTILPNRYDILFYDNKSLKNVRNLEYSLFNKYIGSIIKIPKDELIVFFNKKQGPADSYSFFSIYSSERIGIAQFSLALLFNVLCSLLFYVGSTRRLPNINTQYPELLFEFPVEVNIAIALFAGALVYFLWPWIINLFVWLLIIFRLKKKI